MDTQDFQISAKEYLKTKGLKNQPIEANLNVSTKGLQLGAS
jgi:hypothetical protein